MWKVTFNESGGYDCMTPAHHVERENSREVVVVDAKNFGWFEAELYAEDHPARAAVLARCEQIATLIALALNTLE